MTGHAPTHGAGLSPEICWGVRRAAAGRMRILVGGGADMHQHVSVPPVEHRISGRMDLSTYLYVPAIL